MFAKQINRIQVMLGALGRRKWPPKWSKRRRRRPMATRQGKMAMNRISKKPDKLKSRFLLYRMMLKLTISYCDED